MRRTVLRRVQDDGGRRLDRRDGRRAVRRGGFRQREPRAVVRFVSLHASLGTLGFRRRERFRASHVRAVPRVRRVGAVQMAGLRIDVLAQATRHRRVDARSMERRRRARDDDHRARTRRRRGARHRGLRRMSRSNAYVSLLVTTF